VKAAVVLFTRDLRVHDHPALARAAREARRVVPAFVIDDALLARTHAGANRLAFLVDALGDLDRSLRARGAALVLRRGDVVEETMRLAREVSAEAVFASRDVTDYAQQRQRRLATACAANGMTLALCPGVTVVPPGDLRPTGGDHFKVFTPYWRRWRAHPRRSLVAPPRRLYTRGGGGTVRGFPFRVASRPLPRLRDLVDAAASSQRQQGGERHARRRLEAWLRNGLARYPERHDDLASAGTSRLSADLHFGCLSPSEILARVDGRPGGDAFARQLCWRDFFHQVLAARPDIVRTDYRPRGDRWRRDARGLAAWKAGRTGYPVVDAAMRQLAAEGFMPNRSRLLVASFLVKDLHVDWREGAAHFADLLVDADVANNVGSWQWVAGTGNDTRPNRVFNPVSQARRFDPDGRYVRRWVPELARVRDGAIHEPWRLPPSVQRQLRYPARIVVHEEAVARRRAPRA
jgi:deoxyribodipyrimidine photo-lyase